MAEAMTGPLAMTFQDVLSILNLVVVGATSVVVTWYTWETRQLRHATLRQTALQIRPFLAIEYRADLKIWVHNLGKGVARDIRFHNVRLGEGAEGAPAFLSVAWQPIDFISEGQTRELQGVGEFVTAEQRAASAEAVASWMATFGPSGSAVYEFLVDYADLAGMRYRAAFKVHRGHTEVLRDTEL